MTTVHLVTVVGGRVHLLDRLIEHYRHIGVNGRILVGVHLAHPDDHVLHEAKAILRRHGTDAATVAVGPWRHRVNPAMITRLRALLPDDWCVIADQDEFQEYPDDVTAVAASLDSSGHDALTGMFVDRVGVEGELATIEPGRSLWDTFPLGARLTEAVLGAANKVVLARSSAVVSWGNHYVQRGRALPADVLRVPVHHFKWDRSVVDRLRHRYALYTELGEPYAHESDLFLEHIRVHGAIDVGDPRFGARWVGNPYGDRNRLC